MPCKLNLKRVFHELFFVLSVKERGINAVRLIRRYVGLEKYFPKLPPTLSKNSYIYFLLLLAMRVVISCLCALRQAGRYLQTIDDWRNNVLSLQTDKRVT